ncbi:hypothetical protein PAMP_011782 [Pampus punctatissimus]
MVYVSNGQVLDSWTQSPWRLSFLTDLFWGAVEFFSLFFRTIFNPHLKKDGYSGSSHFPDGRGPPGPPRRRMGRINHGGGPNPPPAGG